MAAVLRRLLDAVGVTLVVDYVRAPRHLEPQMTPTEPARPAMEPAAPDPVMVLRAARTEALRATDPFYGRRQATPRYPDWEQRP